MDPLGTGKLIDLTRDLFGPIGTTLSDVWAVAVGDRMTSWRVRNAMKYQPLLQQEAARLGLTINHAKIPDRYAFAWFEEATKQDEPEIQILFARLLARAAAEKEASDRAPDRRLIDVLGRFTPDDALLFQRLYSDQPFPDTGSYSDTKGLGQPPDRGYPVDWLTSLLAKVHHGYSPVSLDSLVLYGCIDRHYRLAFDKQSLQSPKNNHNDAAQKLRAELEHNVPRMVKQREYIESTDLGLALYTEVKE
jgi:hypothetical protein